MRNNQNQYVHGSLAYKLNTNDEVEKVRKRQRKVNKELFFYRLNLIISIFVVFGMVAGLMTQYSSVAYKQDQLKKIEKEIKLTQDNLYDAKVEVAESMDSSNVHKVATQKLGMVKAADYQMIYIDVPEENYTIKY
ncbi:MAG TPA: hypothetical protein DEP72_07510 [Clostridiales bacterium]|nr:MAG: hypothetical protein A2Y18_07125 [Clostridiales bacterium GWD2_32_19]HCC07982.1 hypothetical protein [Clostridiales bacterium]